jgi:hypothetical protein
MSSFTEAGGHGTMGEAYFLFENVTIGKGQFQALGPPPARDLVDSVDLDRSSILISGLEERVVEKSDGKTEIEYVVSFRVGSSIPSENSLSRTSTGDDNSDDEETADQRGDMRSRSRSSSLSSLAKSLGENMFGWYKKPTGPPVDPESEAKAVEERTVFISCESEEKANSLLEALENEIRRTGRQKKVRQRMQLNKDAHPGSPVPNNKAGGSASTPSSCLYPPLSRSSPVTDSEDSVNYVERERQVYRWLQLSEWRSTEKGVLPDSIMFPLREEGSNVAGGDGGSSSSSSLSSSSSPFSLNNNSPLTSNTVCFMTSAKCKGAVHGEELLSTILRMDFINYLSPFRSFEVVREMGEGLELVRIVLNDMSQEHEQEGENSDIVVRRSYRTMEDGAVVVCLDSASAEDSPPPVPPGCRRRTFNAAYVIEESPRTQHTQLTFVCNLDVEGLTSSEGKDEVLSMRRHVESVLEASAVQGSDSSDAEAKSEAKGTSKAKSGSKSKSKWWPSSSSSSVVQTESRDNGDVQGGDEKSGGGTAERTFYNTPYPATCPTAMSGEPEASSFKVRGASYLRDGEKIPSAPHVLKMCCVDLFRTPETTQNVCSRADNRVFQAWQRGEADWYFVLNIMVPVKKGRTFSYVVYWTGDKNKLMEDSPLGTIARRFINDGDDAFRNSRFKLIPKVVEGPTLVKMTVKDKPTLLGNKLTQHYYRGDNYFEVDVDVGSSVIAYNTVGMCLGVSEKLVVDMGITLQGNEEDELPEVMLASVTGVYLDASLAKDL